jgi:hypothetical protein
VTWAHVTPGTSISERPPEVEDRAVPGHWEGDLLIGLERSAIGTVVERTIRFTLLVHLQREEGYRHKETPKNGPALGGYGALTMKNALTNTTSSLPTELTRSLTWDRGKEMSAHAQLSKKRPPDFKKELGNKTQCRSEPPIFPVRISSMSVVGWKNIDWVSASLRGESEGFWAFL